MCTPFEQLLDAKEIKYGQAYNIANRVSQEEGVQVFVLASGVQEVEGDS